MRVNFAAPPHPAKPATEKLIHTGRRLKTWGAGAKSQKNIWLRKKAPKKQGRRKNAEKDGKDGKGGKRILPLLAKVIIPPSCIEQVAMHDGGIIKLNGAME